MVPEQTIARYRRWYRKLLRCYTRPYRERFAESMEQTFNDLCRERVNAGQRLIAFVLWVFLETSAGIVRDNGRFIMSQSKYFFGIGLAVTLVVVGVSLAGGRDPDLMSLVVALLVFLAAIAYAATNRHNTAYRTAVAVALVTTFILFWMIGAVGLMGNDHEHPNDLMYIMVPIVGIIGASIARFQPHGMARTLIAMAVAQLLVPVFVVIAGLNLVPISMLQLIMFSLIVNGPFAALYLGSAWLFRKASPTQPSSVVSLAG